MKIIGLTLVRNESLIMQETLDHFGEFCTGGIYVIDDCSSDDTYEIIKKHKDVTYCEQVPAYAHDPKNWPVLQVKYRQRIYDVASQYAQAGDWFLLFDADERIEYDFTKLNNYDETVTCVYMKLFDFYITQTDADASYAGDLTSLRKRLGPEHRPILFLFKHDPGRRWMWVKSRTPEIDHAHDIAILEGHIRHYGKSISVDQWEETCDHYIVNSPQFSAKWKARKGKAVHGSLSDFGYPLISWDEKDAYEINVTVDGGTSPAELAKINWFGQKRLNLLVVTNHLFDFTGSEITALTIAEHLAQWHNVTLHARYISAEFIRRIKDQGFAFIEELDNLPHDAFHAAYTQHHTSAFAVRCQFPSLPIVHAFLGILPDLEQPPACDLGISAFLALSEEVRNKSIAKGVPSSKVKIFRNVVDHKKFMPVGSIAPEPRRALVLSYKIDAEKMERIKEACAKLDITVVKTQGPAGAISQEEIARLINSSDLVFTLGRGVIETMMCGRIPLVFDMFGGDGLVTPSNVMLLAENNFSGRKFQIDYSTDDIINEIGKYKQTYGLELRSIALREFDATKCIGTLSEMLHEASKTPPCINAQHIQISLDSVFNIISTNRKMSQMEHGKNMMARQGSNTYQESGTSNIFATIHNTFKKIDESQWVETICRSATQPVLDGVRFPGFPDPGLSVAMVGSSGERALREVAPIYLAIHDYARAAGLAFTPDARILDFGCGFGRILRFFMKDVTPGNLIGTDVDASFIALCKELFHGGDFEVNAPYPPLRFADHSFDVIYAYSVFSHLSEKAHLVWLKELRRVIKPGGLLFLTIRQKHFIAECVRLRTRPRLSAYEQKMAETFGDMETILPRYIRGEFIYAPYGGGGVRTADFYGDTIIPPKYIEKHWTSDFRIVDLIDDAQRFSQAFVVLQPREKNRVEAGSMRIRKNDHTSFYDEVKKCDLCGEEAFRPLSSFPSHEWDGVAAFYKKYPADNPFVHIRKTHTLMQCMKCGLMFVAPRIKDWVVNRWYDEYLSGKYREFITEYDASGRKKQFNNYLKFIETFTDQTKGGNLLDIGCANGEFLNIACGRYKTFGIEVSTIAGSKAKAYGNIRIGDASEQLAAFPDGFFDIATSIDSIEHLKSPAAMISRLSQKMKARGVIFIDTPNADAGFDVMSRHFFLFSIGTLSRLLEQNGLQVIAARTTSDVYNSTDTILPNRFIQVIARKK